MTGHIGRQKYAYILSLVSGDPAVTPQAVKSLLGRFGELAHVTVEINPWPACGCACNKAETNS